MDPFEERYGKEIATWLHLKFKAFSDTEQWDCMDNYRVADKDNEEEMKAYKEKEANGCCGHFDTTFHHWPSGRTFFLGFNYGH